MRSTLCTLVLMAVSGAAAAAAPGAGELVSHIPSQARTVVSVDGAALRAHPAVQEYLTRQAGKWATTNGDVQEFLAEAGLDPTRDVDAVIMALIAGGPHPQGIMLIAGSFSPDRIAAAATARGAVETSLAGHPVFHLPQTGELDKEGPVFAMLSPELAVIGDVRSVADLLKPLVRASGMVDAEVAAGRLDPRAPFWFVTELPAAGSTGSAPWTGGANGSMAGVERAAGSVTRFGLSGSLAAKAHLRGWALTDSAENAELLRDAARGAVAALRLQAAGNNQDLINVLRDIDIRTRNTVVYITADLPLELWETLFSER